jgi:hypothetical protein
MQLSWTEGRRFVRSVAGRADAPGARRPLSELPAPVDPEGMLRCPVTWSPRVLALVAVLAAAWLDGRRRIALAEVADLIGLPEAEVCRWLGPVERQGHGHIRAVLRGRDIILEDADGSLGRPERFAPSRLPAARLAAAPDALTARAWLVFEAAASRKQAGHRWMPDPVPAGPRRRPRTGEQELARLLGLPDGADPTAALAAALPWVKDSMPGYVPAVVDGVPTAPPVQRRSGWVPNKTKAIHGTYDAWSVRLHWVPASRAFEEAVLVHGLRAEPVEIRNLWLLVAAWLADPGTPDWPFDNRYLRASDIRAAHTLGGPAEAHRELLQGILRASGATAETPAGVPWRIIERDRVALEEAAELRGLGETVAMPKVTVRDAPRGRWLHRERRRLYRVAADEIRRHIPGGLPAKTAAAVERLAEQAAAMPSGEALKVIEMLREGEDPIAALADTLTRRPHLARLLARAWRAAVEARRPALPGDVEEATPQPLPTVEERASAWPPEPPARPARPGTPRQELTVDGCTVLRREPLGDWMHEVLWLDDGDARVIGTFAEPLPEVAALARAAGMSRKAPRHGNHIECDPWWQGDAAAVARFISAWEASGMRLAA